MAKRKNTTRVNTNDLQGPGSYIEIRRPTVGELREFRVELWPILERYMPDGKLPDSATSIAMSTDDETAVDEATRRFWSEHIVSWDWVDDHGEPLPSPNGNVEVFSQLTDAEFAFVRKQFEPALNKDEKKR